VDVIFLNFQKTFEKVPHMRLLEKMKAHEVGGKILKWIEKLLTGKQQRVVINGQQSAWMEVSSGVPQGSLLGSNLFTIFMVYKSLLGGWTQRTMWVE